MKREFVYVLHLICAAMHLSQVLSSGGAPAFSVDVVLNSSDFQIADSTVYDFGPGDGYYLLYTDECPNNTFSIDTNTGEVVITQQVEFPIENQEPVCVKTSQGDITSIQTYTCFAVIETEAQSYGVLMIIHVLPDSASTQIQFQEEFYWVEVMEGVQGAPVLGAGGIQAISLPITGLSTPSYRILNGHSSFALSEYSVLCCKYLQIHATQALDREMQDYYEIRVEAYIAQASANTTIIISVLDNNDEKPKFQQPPDSATVSNSSLSIGQSVAHFEASDDDLGLNARLFYSLASLSSPFTINPSTGSLFRYSSQSLQQTTQTVEVSDLGSPQHGAQANFTIFIDTENQQLPTIHDLGSLVASESEIINHVVSTVHITYSSSGSVVANLESFDCNCFKLSTLTEDSEGEYSADLLVNSQLDFESFPNGVNITITAADAENAQYATTKTVEIIISDVNESPVFPESEYEITLPEGTPVGSEIFRVAAMDPDIGSNGKVSYTFVDVPENNPFSLNSTNGIIHSAEVINYEVLKTIDLTISAEDEGGEMDQTMLKVIILDRNDQQPSFTHTEQTVEISETILANESIFHFAASDEDSQCNGAISYSIVHAEPPLFLIDPVSGLLYSLEDDSIDFELFQSAVVVVRASDLGVEGSEFTDTTLHISVEGVNDERPQMSKIECPCFMMEATSTMQTCLPLSAYDADSNILTFTFHSGNEHNLFSISPESGIVSTTQTLTPDDGLVYTLEIIASDGELESDPEILKIIVVDRNNDIPQYSDDTIQLTRPVDTPIGSKLGNVTVQQGDSGYNALTKYEIISTGVEDVIRIDSLSGVLYLNSTPQMDAYSFSVTATDGLNAGNIATASVSIQFSGQSNHPPRFKTARDHFDIASNSQTGEVLYTFTANDSDSGVDGTLTYSLATSSGFFGVSAAGSLSLSQSLSAEVGSEFTLMILVSDGGSPSLQDTLELTITVYESSINIGGEMFMHNPGIGIRHSIAEIPEGTSESIPVISLPQFEGGNVVQYAILPQGSFFNVFNIQNQNEVFIKENFEHVFDRMQNEAIFTTIRAQYASNFHYTSLTVAIQDTNNHGPTFSLEQYSVEIYRNTPKGGYIFEFDAEDPDLGSNAITTYTVAPPSPAFAIVQGTAFLQVAIGDLQSNYYNLTIVASDAESIDLPTDTATLMITILETSNTPPIINSMTYSVPESSAVGSELNGQLEVTDTDSGVHGKNILCLASGNVGNQFRLAQNRDIVLKKELDYESVDSFTLSIMAYDASLNPASSVTQVHVVIEDDNDEPKFMPESYFATIVENNPTIMSVLTVKAIDADSGDAIEYSIENGTSVFSVHPTTGLVSTTTSLNRESVTQHSFLVSATDEGGRVSLASVLVTVLDENDNDPNFFSPNFVTVSEDTPAGAQVIQLEAMDDDKGQNGSVKFEIMGGNEENVFLLDPFTGRVTLGSSLDFETDPQSIVLTFSVSDVGFPPRTSSVTHQIIFSLENANDNFPLFSSQLYSCSIREGTNDFTSPCEVSATDADESDSVTYMIVSGNIENAFQVHPQTGLLSSQSLIDREGIPRYFLKVKATDTGSPSLSSYTLVVIEVQDENDDIPKFDPVIATHIPDSNARLSQMYLSESLPSNTLLFFAHALDSDIGANGEISYNIISDNTGLFYVKSHTSAVFLIGSLDFETAKRHSLEIQATNPSGTSTSQTYTINVLNENENLFPPVFFPNSAAAVPISATAPIGTCLTQVNATDTDPGQDGVIRYYITGGSGYGYFTIDIFDGRITVLRDLTGIETSEVTLDILARDLGFPPLGSSFTLTALLEPDYGAKPFFTNPIYNTLAPETFTAQNLIFVSVEALVSGRPMSDITYSIVSGNEEGKFSMNASSGAVSEIGTLNREVESMYTLFVSASRGSTINTSYTLIAIEVADSNDNTPAFEINYDVTIFNDHPTGLDNAFMRIFAVDEDVGQNGRLEYSITSDTSNNFAIDSTSGDLYLVQSLPTDGSNSYGITVGVTDMATLPLTASTTFIISTIPPATNDAAPSFSSASTVVEVTEDAAPGLLLHTAQASDDSDDHLVYRITQPIPNFAIMPNTGKVYLIKPLDREEEGQYTIRIEASDGRFSSSLFLLNIVVTDINDNRPAFTTDEFVFTVEEHSSNGRVVGPITATDIDDDNTITYSLIDSKDPKSTSLFSLTDDGMLRVAGTIDREIQPIHILTVSAEDNGTPSLTTYARVKVIVTDINDYPPAFVSPLQNVSISENATVGTPFFNVSVFDPDTGVRRSLSYSLSPDTTPFAINESTGELYVAEQLDAEKKTSYSVQLTVSSIQTPMDTATITLMVTVADELDSVPVLSDPGNITLTENMPPYSIVAYVGDNVSLSSVYYDIISGNEENAFFVEPLTGIVRTAVILDRESTPSYTLTIQGSFQTNYEATVTFRVLVGDVNDKAPSFSSKFLEYTLKEDSTVSELDFTDGDEGANKQIGGFYIPDPTAARAFEVDSSGNIQTLQSLDREGNFDAIDFDLYLFDSGNPPLYDLAHISITVSDVNDNPPYFLQPSYSFIVSLPVMVDTALFRIQAMDMDEDSTVRYAIIGGNGTDKFSINAITGEISVANNYNLQAYYSLTLSAQDEGGRESSVNANIVTKHCGFMNLLFNPRDVIEKFPENVANRSVVFSPTLVTFDMPANSVLYSFSTADSLFQINDITGVVSLNGHLDREQQSTHQFTIQARDVANPLRIAQADIEIIVEDINDNSPIFQSAPYETYVTGDYSGSIIRVRAVDNDEGSNGEVQYELKAGCSSLFEIEENTGQISLMEALDTVSLQGCTLYVVASDKGEPPMSETTTVTVNVVLSNAPLFTMNGVYSAQVNESAARDTLVIRVVAMATSDSPQIRYNIASSQSNILPFSIDFTQGDVTVNGIGLDYETNSSYRLQLEAVDLTTTLTGRATLDIQVIDENDNRPEFKLPLYQNSLTENSDAGTPVEQVSASDLDSGLNSDITYFIDPNDIATTLFNIDEETGSISTSVVIDREANDFIRFSVFARDGGSPALTGTTTVQIEVLDVNDNTPAFLQSSYHGTILENDPLGTSILFVTATDLDDDDIEYEIIPTPGSSNFDISTSGLITLATAATELMASQYQLNVTASDGLFNGYTEVIVELENENNHAPMFNASTYSQFILENTTIGNVVVQVFATDGDRGVNAELTYSMSSNLFAIDPESGVITVSAELDREANPNGVALIVIARDGGGRTGTAEVDIELGDINDNAPVFSQEMYGFDVLESTTIGTTVSTVVMAIDPDAGSNSIVQYTINPTSDPSQFPFAIDEQSGDIRTILPLDPTFQSEYIFTVSAMDMGTPVMTAEPSATVTVQVNGVGQVPPQFENSSYQVEIPENNQYGTHLLTPQLVTTNETIQCDVITYSLIGSNVNFFQIADDTSSSITVTTILDREDMVIHSLTIQAQCLPLDSPNVIPAFAVITVTVLDVNEPPEFSSAFLIGSILENIPLNTILGFNGGINFIEADDEDNGENGDLTYSIREEVPFVIHPVTGIISVSGSLDREATDTYRFDVYATDLGNPPLSDNIRIRVIVEDTNDSPPVFEQGLYSGQVVENAGVGTSVVTVEASDEDLAEFAVNTYSVSGSDVFMIGSTTGELTVAGEIDRETTSMYTLSITASDGVNQASTTVVINVTDVNDNPPSFNDTQYGTEVQENYATGVTILQVFATDMDLGENAEISYGILEDQQLIQINSTTGEVSFFKTPDYEMSPQGHFEFRVTAGNPNDENQRAISTLIIDLVDLNDNAPHFTDQGGPLRVTENQPSGITVVRVVADDLDSGLNARVQYSLSEKAEEYFTIDSQTGTIETNVTFDREINATYEISVTATDLGLPPMSGNTTLLIAISDENDNPPVFFQESYTVAVLESEQVGTAIRNIRADDSDEGTNAEIMYRLTGENSGHFSLMMLDDGSFDIKVAQELNHENIDKYYLNITAFDGGFPFLQATVPLTIVVQDENDNPPEFDPPFYSVEYPESLPMGSEITQVHARDPDSADLTQLTYSIFQPDSHPQFEIDTFDGRILLAQALDFEEDQVHILVVQADDQVNSMATASVIVKVTNVNDNAPEFVMSNFTTTVTENEAGHTLFDFMVHDMDRDSNPNTISFKIDSGNTDGIFAIGPTSGVLTVDEFDFESLRDSSYFLTITASDNEDPPLSGTAYVTVNVEDTNDNPPKGENQVFYVFLYNGQLVLRSLGNLLIRDPDTVNDHQFNVTGGNTNIFRIQLGGGIDILQHPPPPGVYSFTVHVTDGTLGEAITKVNITVINITDAHLAHSFTMQVEAESAVSFLDTNLQMFLKSIESVVMDKTGVLNPNAYLFNITDSGRKRVDISIVVESSGDPIHPNLVQHLMHINRDEIEEKTGVVIVTENVDHCADDLLCPLGTICTKAYQYSSSSAVIGSAAASVVGIDRAESITCSSDSSTCSVPCPEPSYCIQQNGQSVCIDDCTPNPCKNNGKCHDQMPGYYCSCPSGFDGRNCELTTSYFQEGSYAVLPAVPKATNGTIAIEFVVADREDGLLFYSSRFDDDLRDFIALEIIDGYLSLFISYGGEPKRVSVMLNGNGWYTAVVDYTTAEFSLTLKTFNPFTIQEKSFDALPNYSSLSLGGPFIVGHLDDTLNYNYDRTAYSSLNFCVRELVINGQVQDFSNSLDAVDVSPSCEENQCSSDTCKNGGRCIGTQSSFTCVCPVEYKGATCIENSESATFSGDSFIQYEVIESSLRRRVVRQTQAYTTGRTYVNLAIITSSETGTIFQIGLDNEDNFAILEIVDGHLQFRFNLGSGVATTTQTTVQVNDGRSHTLWIERKEKTTTLVIDDTYVARATSPGDSSTLDVQKNRIYLGSSVDSDGKASNGFTGCITGAKLNHKDLPVSGSTKDYLANPSPGVESGCTFEPSQEGVFPTVVTIAAGGVGFLLLVVILPTIIIVCIGGRYAYRRRKKYSPRARQASSRSPTFNWQPVHRTPEMSNSRQRLMLSQPSQVSVSDSFALQDMNHGQTEGSLFAPSTPRTSEHAFTTPEQTPEQPPHQRHRMGKKSSDQEGNQQHTPGGNHHIRKLDFHPQGEPQSYPPKPSTNAAELPKPETQLSNESTSVKKPLPFDPKHVRSLSGHQSIVTTATEISVFDDSEVGTYVFKRIEAANEELRSLQTDQMIAFKEEGVYEPLGSLESLYDILKEEDENFEPVQRSSSVASRPALLPKPQLSSRSNHPTQTPLHTTSNGTHHKKPPKSRNTEKQPNKGFPTTVGSEIASHRVKSNGAPPQRRTEEADKPRKKRRHDRAPPALGAGENLMDRFQKISTSPSRAGEDGANFV